MPLHRNDRIVAVRVREVSRVRPLLRDAVTRTVVVPAPAKNAARLALLLLPNAARDRERVAVATCRLVRAAASAAKPLRSAIRVDRTALLRAANSTVVRVVRVANPLVDRSATIGVRRLAVSEDGATVRPTADRNTATGAPTAVNRAIMVSALTVNMVGTAKRIAGPHTVGDTASASTAAAMVRSTPRMVAVVRSTTVMGGTRVTVVMVREDTPPSAITTAAADTAITLPRAVTPVMVADTVIITLSATVVADMVIKAIIRVDMGEAGMATQLPAITAGTAASGIPDTATVDIGATGTTADMATSRMAGTTALISLTGRVGAVPRTVITGLPAADTVTAVIAANAGCPEL